MGRRPDVLRFMGCSGTGTGAGQPSPEAGFCFLQPGLPLILLIIGLPDLPGLRPTGKVCTDAPPPSLLKPPQPPKPASRASVLPTSLTTLSLAGPGETHCYFEDVKYNCRVKASAQSEFRHSSPKVEFLLLSEEFE